MIQCHKRNITKSLKYHESNYIGDCVIVHLYLLKREQTIESISWQEDRHLEYMECTCTFCKLDRFTLFCRMCVASFWRNHLICDLV